MRVIPFLMLLIISVTSVAQNITLRSLKPFSGETVAGVWGYTDNSGNEYALVGGSKGLHIVNVTNPDSIFQVKFVDGPDNLWKEIRTSGGFAFVTTEASTSPGLQIVDLRSLPDTTGIAMKYWSPMINGTPLLKVHALEVSGNYAYLYGSNIGNGGAVVADISDPWNPVYAGSYDPEYIHDGYVRNDTLYAGHIYAGNFTIVDFRNKTNPVVVASQETPGRFTHNNWLTDNSKYIFTTDEVDDSYLTAYDIRDKQNIKEVDRFQITPGSGSVVHNVLVKNDFAVVSWYKDGVVILDAHRPENLVKVGWYDTYSGTGGGMVGAWSVYPFLPSGTILAGGIQEGLFVLSPVYKRACYLEGTVRDSICNEPLAGVTVSITTTTVTEVSDVQGVYKTGYYTPGSYAVTFTKSGYNTKTLFVNLDTGVVTLANVQLSSSSATRLEGSVKQTGTTTPIKNVQVEVISPSDTLNYVSNNSGEFGSCGIFPQYSTVFAGKWGHKELCMDSVQITPAAPQLPLLMDRGYKDDFRLDFGWTVSSTSTTGAWLQTVPLGFPPADLTTDCGNKAFVTGISPAIEDVDGGYTKLTSPEMDLTIYDDPVINYSRYFNSTGGTSDTLAAIITNGIETDTLEIVNSNQASWTAKSFRVKDFQTVTSTMKVSFYICDRAGDNRVEGGIDGFEVTGLIVEGIKKNRPSSLTVYPNPFKDQFTVVGEKITSIELFDMTGKQLPVSVSKTAVAASVNAELPSGVYFLRVMTDTGTYLQKVVSRP